VVNLPFKATENDVQDFFQEAGVTVDNVTVVKDKFSGEPRGFGFVEITRSEDAEVAIRNCNGKEMMGRALVVNEARPMTSGGGGGGGRRQGGFNRDRGPRY